VVIYSRARLKGFKGVWCGFGCSAIVSDPLPHYRTEPSFLPYALLQIQIAKPDREFYSQPATSASFLDNFNITVIAVVSFYFCHRSFAARPSALNSSNSPKKIDVDIRLYHTRITQKTKPLTTNKPFHFYPPSQTKFI
jgi:hypothetical protein